VAYFPWSFAWCSPHVPPDMWTRLPVYMCQPSRTHVVCITMNHWLMALTLVVPIITACETDHVPMSMIRPCLRITNTLHSTATLQLLTLYFRPILPSSNIFAQCDVMNVMNKAPCAHFRKWTFPNSKYYTEQALRGKSPGAEVRSWRSDAIPQVCLDDTKRAFVLKTYILCLHLQITS
jgi:hypothetical protein